jgi:hypothetical protein
MSRTTLRTTLLILIVVVVLGGLSGSYCTKPQPSAEILVVKGQSSSTSDETQLMFFYLVNQTGKKVQVRVLEDGEELFTQDINAQISTSGNQAPPPPEYPAVELKIPVRRGASRLEVQELLHQGTHALQATFDIERFYEKDGGFRVTIREDGILLSQDYYPPL